MSLKHFIIPIGTYIIYFIKNELNNIIMDIIVTATSCLLLSVGVMLYSKHFALISLFNSHKELVLSLTTT